MMLVVMAMTAFTGFGRLAPVVRAQDANTTCAGEPMIGAPSGGATPAATRAAARPRRLPKIDPATLNIAFLPKDVVNPYFATSAKGAQEAATELGGKFQQVGPQTSNAAEQVT